MARPRTKDNPGPFSLRIPPEMRIELEQIAAQEMRSLHSLILVLLRDALIKRRQVEQESLNGSTGDLEPLK